MVVQGIIALALALPTGMLFGVGYGTGVRIGYEQVYPLLFPQDKDNRNVTPTVENIKKLNQIYDTIGGKEASQMGIAKGLNDAMSQLDKNPDFQDLVELELKLSGRIPSNLDPHNQSDQTSTSDLESGSSLSDFKDSSGNFSTVAESPALYIHILKEQGNNAQTETNFNERKVKLRILISKLSQKEIREAYSDMLSGRLQPSWAQEDPQFKQILTLEFKKLGAGTSQITKPLEPEAIPDTSYTTAVADYENAKFKLMGELLPLELRYIQLKAISDARTGDTNKRIQTKNALKLLQAKQKQIINLVTLARNKAVTKANANTDWRNRIWKFVP